MNGFIVDHAAALSAGAVVVAVALVFLVLALLDPERLDPQPRHRRHHRGIRDGVDPFEVDLPGECLPCALSNHSGCDYDRCTCCGTEAS